MKHLLRLSVVIIFLVPATIAQTPETDFQVWNETTFVLPVLKVKDDEGKSLDRLSLLLITSLRLGQNRLAFVDERIGGGVDVAINKNWNVSPTYLYIAAQPGRSRRDFEHRVRFDLSYNRSFSWFVLRDRNRYEYRFRNSRRNEHRYRNRFSFGVPIKKNDKELFMPFVSDEVYYDITLNQFSRNDLSFGIQKKLTSKITADFFYNWRENRSGLPQTVHAVGANFKIKLK